MHLTIHSADASYQSFCSFHATVNAFSRTVLQLIHIPVALHDPVIVKYVQNLIGVNLDV